MNSPTVAVTGQIIRYAISGGALTVIYSAIYWGTAVPLGVHPLIANSIAFVITLMLGYVVHSRWSFRGHGRRDQRLASYAKFFAVNILGFALNSFWVWLIVQHLGLSVPVSIIPIVAVTPWVAFWLNRQWTFN